MVPAGDAPRPAGAPRERSLFVRRMGSLVTRPPVTTRPDVAAVEVARLLTREGIGSVIVVGEDGGPLGIVTDRDLRRKVVAEGRDPVATTAGAIMSAPLIALGPAALAFDALLEMTRRRIQHVGVVADGRLVGVVSSRDLLGLQAAHPVAVDREIATAGALPALKALGDRVTDLVRQLLAEGGTAYDVGRLVAELNDRIVARVLELTVERLQGAGAAPPDGWCWLAFGSEGRREQTLRTDQDNGLVYPDPAPGDEERVHAAALRFGTEAIRGLVEVGFPPCPGDIMASNPRWCRPRSSWEASFRQWMREGQPADVLAASIFFDLRPVAGASAVGAGLADLVRTEAPGQRRLLGLLARDVVDRRVPLTLFGNVAVHRSGPHRGAVDLKGAGSLQLVGAARVYALDLGLGETNTVDRLRAAAAREVHSEAEAGEAIDAYLHLLRLRLVHQLDRLARGEPADNYVAVAGLSHTDAVLLRDALHVVTRVQGRLRERFATDFLL